MRKKILSYTVKIILILLLSSSCICLAREISYTEEYNDSLKSSDAGKFILRSRLDKQHPGILSIKGTDNETIKIYLLEGTLYKTISVKKKEKMDIKLPSGYYEVVRNGSSPYWIIISPDGKTILQ